MVRLPWSEKQRYRLNSSASNVSSGFDHDHDLDLWIFKVKCDLDLRPQTWPRPWIFMVKFWNNCLSEWEGRLTLNKVGGSRSFMTMTVTICWPRSGVRIYQIVTGVTSVVGVPSTHLVWSKDIFEKTWNSMMRWKIVFLFFVFCFRFIFWLHMISHQNEMIHYIWVGMMNYMCAKRKEILLSSL